MLGIIFSTFITPNIEVQSTTGQFQDGHILCAGIDTCSVNVRTPHEGFHHWRLGAGVISFPNPPLQTFPIGHHTLTLTYTEHGEIHTESLIVTYLPKKGGFPQSHTPRDSELVAKTSSPATRNTSHIPQNTSLLISSILPNPEGSDTAEYIEIMNVGNDSVSLSSCEIDDILEGGSKHYALSGELSPGDTLKVFNEVSKISLNNTGVDEANLICNGEVVDTLGYSNIEEGEEVIRDVGYEICALGDRGCEPDAGQLTPENGPDAGSLIPASAGMTVLKTDPLSLSDAADEHDGESEAGSLKPAPSDDGLLATDTYIYQDTRIRISWKESGVHQCLFVFSNGEKTTGNIEEISSGYRCREYPRSVGATHIQLIGDEGELLGEAEIEIDEILSDFTAQSPTIEIQGKHAEQKFVGDDGVFYCSSEVSNCRVNLIARENQSYTFRSYEWVYPDGSIFETDNPPTVSFDRGKHTVILRTTNSLTGKTFIKTLAVNYFQAKEDSLATKQSSRTEEKRQNFSHDNFNGTGGSGSAPPINSEAGSLTTHFLSLTLPLLSLFLLLSLTQYILNRKFRISPGKSVPSS